MGARIRTGTGGRTWRGGAAWYREGEYTCGWGREGDTTSVGCQTFSSRGSAQFYMPWTPLQLVRTRNPTAAQSIRKHPECRRSIIQPETSSSSRQHIGNTGHVSVLPSPRRRSFLFPWTHRRPCLPLSLPSLTFPVVVEYFAKTQTNVFGGVYGWFLRSMAGEYADVVTDSVCAISMGRIVEAPRTLSWTSGIHFDFRQTMLCCCNCRLCRPSLKHGAVASGGCMIGEVLKHLACCSLSISSLGLRLTGPGNLYPTCSD